MKATKKELEYARMHFSEVHHTTLNPDGPGVVRIHLIPPAVNGNDISASAAIINGRDIIPVNLSWSILLTELIEEINKFSGREVTQEEVNTIIENTCIQVKKVYRFVSKTRLKADIYTIMNTFTQIARGDDTDEEIEYISLGDYAPYMSAPHRMDLMVSAMTKGERWNCNQNCIHCYAAGQAESSENELATEDWKRIIDKCRHIGIPQLTFTGGEPTMRDDLIELIDYSKWFVTRLNTNGIKLTEDYCHLLMEASLDSVQITFYSADENIHNKLVGAPKYKDTVSGIENAVKAGLSVSINTPLCSLNRDYTDTLRFLHDKGVMYVTCSGLITTGNAAGHESEQLQLTSGEIKDILREAVKYCHENGMEIDFTSPGWVDDSFCEEIGIRTPGCGACLSNMALTPGGNAVPCQSWLSDPVLGSFLNDDWDTVWNSEACRERREYSAMMQSACPLRSPYRKEDQDEE